MKECPICGLEYNPEKETCPECRQAILYCVSCEKHYTEDEAIPRVEDNRNTVPCGDTFVTDGGKYKVETCPECESDLEER